MRIAVTGASGFVGQNLIHYLLEHTDHEIVGLSRTPMKSKNPRLTAKVCDLYSLLEVEVALVGCDVAIYLVHSMSPSSRLSQGNFRDFDFLLADNFAKAAAKRELQQIVYVGGLIPDGNDLSEHLESRLEVEKTLENCGVPLTTFRCGLVLGPEGSSFRIVEKLTQRLPIIAVPRWTQTKTQAVSIRDLVKTITLSIEHPKDACGSFDLAAPEILSYSEIIRRVSIATPGSNRFVVVPFIPVWLSKIWVTAVSGTSKKLVYPLVDSLIHPMLAKKERELPDVIRPDYESTDSAIAWSLDRNNTPPNHFFRLKKRQIVADSLVQSVQRLPVPKGWFMSKVADEYMNWLPSLLAPFVTVRRSGDFLAFFTLGFSKPLLELHFSKERTFETRELFYIVGGLLAKRHLKARLEFRESPNKPFFIAAIHSFKPSLPWYVYIYTQALLHKFVMWRFGKHLSKLDSDDSMESINAPQNQTFTKPPT